MVFAVVYPRYRARKSTWLCSWPRLSIRDKSHTTHPPTTAPTRLASNLSSASPCFCTDSCGTSTGTTQPKQPSAPSAGDNEVIVTVRHDNFPLETGWTLTHDSSGSVVASQAGESFSTQGGTSVETVYVADGRYTFKMTDSYGDSICCPPGSRYYPRTSRSF